MEDTKKVILTGILIIMVVGLVPKRLSVMDLPPV